MTLQGHRRSLCALGVFVCLLLAPSLVNAGPSRVGPTFNASGHIGSMVTDIAQDPVNDVYLMVSGQTGDHRRVHGRFVHGDGTPLGGIFHMAGTYSQLPRVAYSAALGGFLVTWLDLRGDVWGRYVRYSPGGTPVFATGEFVIARPYGGARSSTNAAVACAGGQGECLVAWHQQGVEHTPIYADIHAVRVDLTGQRVGVEYVLSHDGEWQAEPSVGFDPRTGVYVVFHADYIGHTGTIWANRIQASSGAALGVSVLAQGGTLYKPEPAFNSRSGQFLVTWHDAGTGIHYGRFFNSDGAMASEIKPLIGGGAYDGNAIAYNAVTDSYFGVTHGAGLDDLGFEVSAAGVPTGVIQATAIGGGNYYPRVAAHHSRPEWMVNTTSAFLFMAAQRIITDTQPGPRDPDGPDDGDTDIDLSPAGAPNGSWFFAEGHAQDRTDGFKTYYLVANENPEPVDVRAYFSGEDGRTFSRRVTVPAYARKTVNLQHELNAVGSFGTVFQSLTPGYDIFVERSIYWGPELEGSTAEVATKTLALDWYFGEGSRPYFNNYYLLFNPNQVGGSATFTFFLENGTQVERVVQFGPQSRFTMDANTNLPELEGQNFGVRVRSTVPIVAERAMYFGLGPAGFIGGTASIGAPGLWNHWMFAEGSAGTGFETFYLLMNPNPHPITVTRRLYLKDGSQLTGEVTIDPGSRRTVWINDEMGPIGDVAAYFNSSHNFIAERSIYWGANGWIEGANVIGATSLASDWHVPEGTEGGAFDSYLLILNPGAAPVTADITLFIEGVGRFTAPPHLRPVVPAGARVTIGMRDFLRQLEEAGGYARDSLIESSFSTRVTATGGEGIVVEHALYRTFQDGNFWRTGGAALGVPR